MRLTKHIKRLILTNIGKDIEKMEPSYIAGEKVKR